MRWSTGSATVPSTPNGISCSTAGQPMRLRAKAFHLLCYLVEHRDRTILKQELCEQILAAALHQRRHPRKHGAHRAPGHRR